MAIYAEFYSLLSVPPCPSTRHLPTILAFLCHRRPRQYILALSLSSSLHWENMWTSAYCIRVVVFGGVIALLSRKFKQNQVENLRWNTTSIFQDMSFCDLTLLFCSSVSFRNNFNPSILLVVVKLGRQAVRRRLLSNSIYPPSRCVLA